MVEADPHGEEWTETLGIPAHAVNGWLVFADPFRFDGDDMLKALAGAYPGATISGGFASNCRRAPHLDLPERRGLHRRRGGTRDRRGLRAAADRLARL